MDEIIFEQYGFSRALVTHAPLMAAYDPESVVAGAGPREAQALWAGGFLSFVVAKATEAPYRPAGSPASRARAALVLDAGFSYTCAGSSPPFIATQMLFQASLLSPQLTPSHRRKHGKKTLSTHEQLHPT